MVIIENAFQYSFPCNLE